MQKNSQAKFKKTAGEVFSQIRKNKSGLSLNTFSRQYDFDRGNLSKVEKGLINCRLITAYKFAQACNLSFSDFAKILEENLGKDFTLIDE